MKPENHAIRQLEKQLEGATPEVADAIERVILSLKACLMNVSDRNALAFCRHQLANDVAALNEILKAA